MAPIQHNEEPETFSPVATSRQLRPGAHEDVVRPRIDDTLSDPKVKKALAKLKKMEEADAPATVLTRCRAAVESARTDYLERIAEARHAEREATLAKQRETRRLEAEREVLYRLDQSLTPQITINFGPLQVVSTPEKSPDATLRGWAYHDIHAAMQIISTATNHAAGMSRHAGQRMEVLPLDVPKLRRTLEDVCRRSIRVGLTSIEEIS